jgi:hypothetical protein
MPLSEDERGEIGSLVTQLDCGDLDDPGKQRLADLLRQQPEAIELYLDQFEAEAMLRETYGSLIAFVSPIKRKQPAKMPVWRPAAAVVVVLAVGISFGNWWTGNQLSAIPESEVKPQRQVDEAPSPQPSGAVMATVVRNSGTEIQYQSGEFIPAVVGRVMHAGRYKLRGGILELIYESGAMVILESPATVELQSRSNLVLGDGRLSVRCITEESKGFVVETPTGSAIDLGTEFAVEVDASGTRDDEYHVFTGEVVIERRAVGVPERVAVKEGQAVRLDRDTSTPAGIDLDYQRFIRSFDTVSTDYYDQVLKLDPAVYYAMRPGQGGHTLRNEVSDEFIATVHSSAGGISSWAPGFNGGTAFQLNGVGTYAVALDYPKSQGDRMSVVAWVFAESRPSWASIAKNWGHGLAPDRRGQFHFGLHKLDGDFHGSLEAHINDRDNVEQFAIEDVPIPLNRWHHVAMVADGAVLRLYRNGKEVAATTYSGLNGNPDIKALAIGTKLDNSMRPAALNPLMDPVSRSQGFWDGCIDHLAIFNEALTAEQIKELYEVGNASMRDFRHSP